MTAGFARLAVELLQQVGSALPDTIITKQVAVEQGAFAKVASVAQGLMSIAILVLTVVLVPAAWNFRSSYKTRQRADRPVLWRHWAVGAQRERDRRQRQLHHDGDSRRRAAVQSDGDAGERAADDRP